MVAEANKSKVYPEDVKKFLYGLYASLHLTDTMSGKDMEKVIFFAYRNGYLLGVGSQGGSVEDFSDRLPDFGLDETESDK